ncbi:MAG: outer membrane protein assembly factor BamD [Bacteroidetes bacterium MedPE-SWsnd-G2]|nr:MAG: outer membrane protein assembly factor BamD [Bacteroidetes bacterium MedPE-SWsnd-G2]
MKHFFITILAVMALSSCSEYQKALKSEDTGEKFKLATELYDQGKYSKANRLFAQIEPKYKGKPQAEKLMFLYAKTYYMMEDFYLSGYRFDRFVSSYPKSEKLEEAAFLGAKSFYELSPIYSKEQKETVEAIQKLQIFVNRFPDSQYLIEANALVKELDYKLEKKAFSIAKQYNTINDYQASVSAFDNFILEYPGTSFREEAMFIRFDSAYKLAINSVQRKKEERIENAFGYYNAFTRSYSASQFIEQANEMKADLENQQEQFRTKS